MKPSLFKSIAAALTLLAGLGASAAEAAAPATAIPSGALATAPSPALESKFRRITPGEITGNVFKMVASDWMLITAGTPDKFNSMTAGWGGFGVMWSKPVTFILVRNARYTYEFLEREPYYTLTFFDKQYKPQLLMFGTKSGRKVDKLKESGFTPLNTGYGMAYEEAKLIIACRKMYGDRVAGEKAFDPPKSVGNEKDYHKLYFGEIVGVWVKK